MLGKQGLNAVEYALGAFCTAAIKGENAVVVCFRWPDVLGELLVFGGENDGDAFDARFGQ